MDGENPVYDSSEQFNIGETTVVLPDINTLLPYIPHDGVYRLGGYELIRDLFLTKSRSPGIGASQPAT